MWDGTDGGPSAVWHNGATSLSFLLKMRGSQLDAGCAGKSTPFNDHSCSQL